MAALGRLEVNQMHDYDWRKLPTPGSTGRTALSQRRQAEQYAQHQRWGNDATNNNPSQR